ncbi:baculoviral IAP repeat-containing protein 3 [Biomphalaria pfeifferi]|uniref:Baculoviral IAP repeat-containing protein 3 n=1 Tax=Biomphalaria pfeifferi TaxID=112525 RepID=A0AAD8FGR8_BIOPF|nr:baculoviral IAP repeat-containing protein 3 [Biomphalaria pfeifferi]
MLHLQRTIKTFHYSSPSILKHEIYRLQTFVHYPLESFKSATLLAANGFVYVGNGKNDKVICNFCKVCKDNWKVDDKVEHMHSSLSPNCPLVTGIDCDNIEWTAPAQSLSVLTEALYSGQHNFTTLKHTKQRILKSRNALRKNALRKLRVSTTNKRSVTENVSSNNSTGQSMWLQNSYTMKRSQRVPVNMRRSSCIKINHVHYILQRYSSGELALAPIRSRRKSTTDEAILPQITSKTNNTITSGANLQHATKKTTCSFTDQAYTKINRFRTVEPNMPLITTKTNTCSRNGSNWQPISRKSKESRMDKSNSQIFTRRLNDTKIVKSKLQTFTIGSIAPLPERANLPIIFRRPNESRTDEANLQTIVRRPNESKTDEASLPIIFRRPNESRTDEANLQTIVRIPNESRTDEANLQTIVRIPNESRTDEANLQTIVRIPNESRTDEANLQTIVRRSNESRTDEASLPIIFRRPNESRTDEANLQTIVRRPNESRTDEASLPIIFRRPNESRTDEANLQTIVRRPNESRTNEAVPPIIVRRTNEENIQVSLHSFGRASLNRTNVSTSFSFNSEVNYFDLGIILRSLPQ